MKRQSLRVWVKNHREAIDVVINNARGYKRPAPTYSEIADAERMAWVMNLEGLYDWARSEGARV